MLRKQYIVFWILVQILNLSELFSSDEYQDEVVSCDKCNVCQCLSNTRNCFRDFHTTTLTIGCMYTKRKYAQ